MKRTLVALAGVAALAAASFAFENTSWFGNLECDVKVKVRQGTGAHSAVAAQNVSLSTTNTAFTMGPLGGLDEVGTIRMNSDHNYSASAPPDEDPAGQALFKLWVRGKVLTVTGIDVNVVACSLKGKFVLNDDFSAVRVIHKITFAGTVASGEDSGKPVKGSIKIRGSLPRD